MTFNENATKFSPHDLMILPNNNSNIFRYTVLQYHMEVLHLFVELKYSTLLILNSKLIYYDYFLERTL